MFLHAGTPPDSSRSPSRLFHSWVSYNKPNLYSSTDVTKLSKSFNMVKEVQEQVNQTEGVTKLNAYFWDDVQDIKFGAGGFCNWRNILRWHSVYM
jgi:hypothetical protein